MLQATYLKLYFLALFILLSIDAVWLGVVAKDFYKQQFGTLMKTEMNWIAAGLVYVVLVGGLVGFAIAPAIESKSWMTAVVRGGLFGFVCYATYDLTNLATIKNWSLLITGVDMLWGTVLGAVVSGLAFFVFSKLT